MTSLKAVLFDLDGTLRHHLPTGGEVFVQYLNGLNIHITYEEALRAERWEHFYFAYSLEIQADRQRFNNDSKQFWINFSQRRLIALGLEKQKAAELAPEVSAYMGSSYKPEVYIPEEAPMVLTQLKQAGHILGVVSNRDERFDEELKDLRLDSYFDFTLAAGEVNSFKPDSLIFEHALKRAGVNADEAAYVGDNYFADIVGSARAGLMPVLFDPKQLFPDAECATIRSFDELPNLLT